MVEAKANLEELESDCQAKERGGRGQIEAALASVTGWTAALERQQAQLGIPPSAAIRRRIHELHLPVVIGA